jgi:hypothetical protein
MKLKMVNQRFMSMFVQEVEFDVLCVGCPPEIKQCELVLLHLTP